jgi:uncharacterized protein YdiU (UPF0061 family)
MNTDNMAVSGETIDYGPCAFMESFSPHVVFSSIDTGGRYAYGNQPMIARWNLARFAETLLPLIDDTAPERAVAEATDVINGFIPRYEALWLSGARAKLGLTIAPADGEEDTLLVRDWLELLEHHAIDFTLGWRRLADAAKGKPESLESLFPSADAVRPWLERWGRRVASQPSPATADAEAMRSVNPIYIPRNHLVEDALAAATNNDLTLFERLLEVIAHPYDEKPGLEDYAQPAPCEFTAGYKTFCGT